MDTCQECGMTVESGEYHPYAACLMFKACGNADTVRGNLQDVLDHVRNAVLEEAMKVCEEISRDKWNLYKGRPPYKGDEEGRACQYTQGMSDGADKCYEAIDALKTKEGGGGGG